MAQNNIEFLISDFNGVLDDYYVQKFNFLRSVLGDFSERFLPKLLVFIERNYISNRSATIEQSISLFLESHSIVLDDSQNAILKDSAVTSNITDDAIHFLDNLNINFIIYTSLSRGQAKMALRGKDYNIYTRDDCKESKPSVVNLESIIHKYKVHPSKVCVIGDGLIDDLMPASLMGMNTILTSPFAKLHINGLV